MTSHPPRELRFRPFRRIREVVLPTKRLVKRPVRLLTLHRTEKRRVTPAAFHQMISSATIVARVLQRRQKLILLLKVTRRRDVTARCCHDNSSFFFSHLPRSDRSGLLLVHSLSRKVHGRMYRESRRAFSSGENCNLGILAKDQVGRYGRGRVCQHQQCRRPFKFRKSGRRIRSSVCNAV